LFHDATVTPLGAPVCGVLTTAKRDLQAGEILDGIGGFTTYGEIDNQDVFYTQDLLPMGLSQDCKLKRDIPKDQAISYKDVELPAGRLCDKLRAEQNAHFGPAMASQLASR
jgi:predicted homoserine dehydrogenase-like protein